MLELVIEARRHRVGAMEVGRLLPFARRRMVGPFIFFDHMGPVDLAPGLPREVDVRPHPHIGLSTVTYLFDGEIMHRDSLGSRQAIRPGEVNWMTAGRGITHSERFEQARAQGGRLHGIQAWVALPEADEDGPAAFDHYDSSVLPVLEQPGVSLRLLAGALFGLQSPVRTHSPLFYAHAQLSAGTVFALPAVATERAAYVVSGAVECDGQTLGPQRLLVFTPGSDVQLRAQSPATLMLLGGEPLGPRYIEWNFVASSRERIDRAKADWRAQRMPLPPDDRDDWIPMPGDAVPANPMS